MSGRFDWRGRMMSFFREEALRPERALTPLEELFWDNDGTVVHKWLHYLPVYERHFARFRGTPVRMLEIGVSEGGSLRMWRRYFGEAAIIYGVDIDPACADFDGENGAVRIGSQADAGFLAGVVEEMGGLDLVLDDGSHHSEHIRASLNALYPRLSDGGVYAIEDLHAAYWGEDFGGGDGVSGGFITVLKQLIDDINHWHHAEGQAVEATAGHLAGLHIYDSMAILDKQAVSPPVHLRRGRTVPGHILGAEERMRTGKRQD